MVYFIPSDNFLNYHRYRIILKVTLRRVVIFFIARHWLEVRTVQELKPCDVLGLLQYFLVLKVSQ